MTSAAPAPRPRRIATVQLTEQMIAHLLGLPEGVRIIGVRDEFASMSVLVMVEGEQLEVCPPGAMPERLAGSWVHERTDAGESVLRYVPPIWPVAPGVGAASVERLIERVRDLVAGDGARPIVRKLRMGCNAFALLCAAARVPGQITPQDARLFGVPIDVIGRTGTPTDLAWRLVGPTGDVTDEGLIKP